MVSSFEKRAENIPTPGQRPGGSAKLDLFSLIYVTDIILNAVWQQSRYKRGLWILT